MKKQFLNNFSAELSNQLNCSSIRINHDQYEQPQQPHQHKKNELLVVGPRLKKYEENDIVGFQMSLQASDNVEQYRELMRSKSAGDFRFPTQHNKLQKSRKLKEGASIRENSLYNTTSFDEVTMNITTNTKNITNIHNQTYQMDENKNSRTLKKPNELSRYKETLTQENIYIKVNTVQDIKSPSMNNQQLIAGLKLSITQQQANKSVDQASYQQPYFKIGSTKNLPLPQAKSHPGNFLVTDHRREVKKKLAMDSTRSNQSKLTLRDYIYLNKLTGKTREKSTQCQSPRSPTLKNAPINSRSAEVMSQLTKQVVSNIELIQGNMNLILNYVKSCKIEDDMSHKQMMNMYNLARLLRQKMVTGNDELVLMLQQASKQ